MTRTLFDIGVAEGKLPARFRPAFERYRLAHDAYWALEGVRHRTARIAEDPAASLYELLQGTIPKHYTTALDTLCAIPVRGVSEGPLREALAKLDHRFARALVHLEDKIGLSLVEPA